MHWQLRNFGMLIGTDQLVFSSAEHPAMTLQLCDMARPLRPLTILDFWLDNLMANIPELCVCGHVDGAVKGYQARAPHRAPHPPPPPPPPPLPPPPPPPPPPPQAPTLMVGAPPTPPRGGWQMTPRSRAEEQVQL